MASAEQLEQFERIGNHGLDPEAALEVLDRLIAAGVGQALVADVDWTRFRNVYEARRARPLVSDLHGAERQPGPVLGTRPSWTGPSGAPWISTLIEAPEGDRETILGALLRAEAASTLGFERAEEVPLDRPFSMLGMDSLMMADFVGRLGKRVGVSCSALVFDHPNVQALAPRLLAALGPALAAVAETSDGGASPGSAANELPAPAVGRPRDAAIDGYAPEREPEALEFQARAWPHRRLDLIAPRWRWMFVDSARRLGLDPQIWLYRDGAAVGGHMGAIPVRLKVGAEEHDTAWLVDTMVLEAYRRHAVGSRLMLQAHDDLPFALSLGQTGEMREIQLRLGWRQVAPLQIAQLLVRPDHVLKGKLPAPVAWVAGGGLRAVGAVREWLSEPSPCGARSIERFDERHDRLWASASRDLTCAVVRDASYLNWKYVDQPGQRFIRLDILDDASLKGVAVWMLREPDDVYRYRRAFLVDLVAPLADGALLRHVIRAACDMVVELGADALLCHHIDARLTSVLQACGFRLREPERFLLVDPGPLSESVLDRVLAPDSWFVTQGDSDIDRPW